MTDNFSFRINDDNIFINYGDGSPFKIVYSNTSDYQLIKKFLLKEGHSAKVKVKEILNKNFDILFEDEKFSIIKKNNEKQIFYDGIKIHNSLTNYIINAYINNYSYKHLIEFMKNVMSLPKTYKGEDGKDILFEYREETINDIFDFVTKYSYPITEDGHIIADRMVQTDFYSQASNSRGEKLCYKPGTIVELPRYECDHDRNNTCSAGIHVRNWGYNLTHGYKRILVKINPKDVVSIPYEDFEKMRVCRLEVLCEIEDDTNLKDSFNYKNIIENDQNDMIEKQISSYDEYMSQFDDDLIKDHLDKIYDEDDDELNEDYHQFLYDKSMSEIYDDVKDARSIYNDILVKIKKKKKGFGKSWAITHLKNNIKSDLLPKHIDNFNRSELIKYLEEKI